MTPERWARVKAVLSAAMDVSPTERAAVLAERCGSDAGLLAEVQSLLDAHERPALPLTRVRAELRAKAFAASGAEELIGERVGAYRIVGLLGSGGMGDVFKAVRDDDQYRAEVAIKLMRADLRGSLTEQRFKSERQILAGLDHRNIARMLDGGTTKWGAPYVVMEIVIGEPIDRYCQARALGVRERVQLFLQVCAAVSYAHQRLIVHRDLKPNNVLVTADGTVKLLDFGIAKLLESSADDDLAGERTQTSMRVMTLEYASPEQVSGGTVTTASDVYSLGVVLYRLLTGRSPYRARNDETQRVAEILSDAVPARPSAVSVEQRMRRELKGDLDEVLLMALRKEPQHRYGSVEQFANDLRNYLAGMPVHARGDAWRYRAGTFVRRRKVELAAAVLVVCSLVGGMAASLHEARVADEQRRAAEQQRQVAQKHFDSVRKLANTLVFDLHDEIEKLPGATRARGMLVRTSLEYLDALFKEAGKDRVLQEELAMAYRKVADIQGRDFGPNTGDIPGALKSYGRAIELLEKRVADGDAPELTVERLASAYVEQSRLLSFTGNPAAALVVVKKATALAEAHAVAFAARDDGARALGEAYRAQADALFLMNRNDEGVEFAEKMIAVAERDWAAHPESPRAMLTLGNTYDAAANYTDARLDAVDALKRSLALYQKAVTTYEALLARDPGNGQYRVYLAHTQINLGNNHYDLEDYASAVESYRRAQPVVARQAQDPDDVRARFIKAALDSGLGASLLKLGQTEEARNLLLEAVSVLQALDAQSSTLRTRFVLAQGRIRLGEVWSRLAANPLRSPSQRLEQWRLAQGALRDGVAGLQKISESVPLQGSERSLLEGSVASLARVTAEIATLEKRLH